MSVFRCCCMARVLGVCALLSHGLAAEFNTIVGLYESIQDGVCERGIRHGLVPVFDGYMACGNALLGADDVLMAVRNHAWRQTLRTSPDAERLVSAYFNADRLDIYDSGVLTHVVSGPDFFEPVYVADEIPGGQILAVQPDNRSGYVDVDVTEEFMYALYSGKKRSESSMGEEWGSYFLVFDWTGKPVGRLNVSGSPSSMAVSADNGDLYAIFLRPVPQNIQFKIPDNLVQ